MFFLVFQTRFGIWGRIPRLRRLARCCFESYPLSAANTLSRLRAKSRASKFLILLYSSIGNTCSLSLPLAGVVELARGIPLHKRKGVNKNTFPFASICNFFTSSLPRGKKTRQPRQSPNLLILSPKQSLIHAPVIVQIFHRHATALTIGGTRFLMPMYCPVVGHTIDTQ